MKHAAYSARTRNRNRKPGLFWLQWVGLPGYPGIVLFFVSVALSHHLLDIIQQNQYDQLAAESVEAVLLGIAAAAAFMGLIRRFSPGDCHTVFSALSIALLPGVLFIFAPFRYAQACRWTDSCQFWSDSLLLAGIALCVVVGVYTWSETIRGGFDWLASRVRMVLDRMPPSLVFLVVWTLCTALLAWRGYERLTHPELFAEGGSEFVSNALSHGWLSLGFLYDGFLHTVPRLIALLATSLAPAPYIPTVTVSVCYLIAGAVSAFIVRPVYRWIIPSDAVRIVAALLLCLIPGFREVLGNLSNLHYVLFFLMGLLVLKDPDKPYRVWELVAALFVVLSSGLAAALVPAAAVRLWIRLSRNRDRAILARLRAGIPEIVFAVLIIVPTLVIALVLLIGGDTGAGSLVDGFRPAIVLRAWGTVLTSAFFLNPFSGPVAATEIVRTVSQMALVLIAGVAYLLLFRSLIHGGWRAQSAVIFGWLAAPFAIIALIALTRSATLKPFLLEESWNYFKWWLRYNYLFVGFGIVAWLALLRPTRLLPDRRAANVLVMMLFVASVSQAGWYFKVDEYGDGRRWNRTSAELERSIRTGCPRSVTVDIYPDDWSFVYHARKDAAECATSNQ